LLQYILYLPSEYSVYSETEKKVKNGILNKTILHVPSARTTLITAIRLSARKKNVPRETCLGQSRAHSSFQKEEKKKSLDKQELKLKRADCPHTSPSTSKKKKM